MAQQQWFNTCGLHAVAAVCMLRSDFACCDDVYKSADDYAYGRDDNSISYRLRNPAAHSSAGYCDWFVSHVDRSTTGGVEVSPGIKKYGKASAICVSFDRGVTATDEWERLQQ
jgi:hypothetical protein